MLGKNGPFWSLFEHAEQRLVHLLGLLHSLVAQFYLWQIAAISCELQAG